MKLYRSRYLIPVSSPAREHGAVVIDGRRIVAVGDAAELQHDYPSAEHVDLGDAILLPALVNAHTHLELTDYPQWAVDTGNAAADGGFTDWILRLIQTKIALGADTERYRQSWLHGLQQCLASGTGLIGDILATADFYATVAQQLPGRCFIEVLGYDPERVYGQWQRLDHCRHHWPQSHWGAAPHAPYTLSSEMLKQSYRYTATHQLRTSIHIAESQDEVDFLQHGQGPIAEQLYPFVGWQHHLTPPRQVRSLACLQQAGALRSDTLLVHGVHLSRQEIDQLAEVGCSMVLCPRSNAKLGSVVAPVADYVDAGVPLALGTDSLASNDSLSLWDEMAFALDWFGGQLSPQQLLHMATVGGARALGFDDVGQLAVGSAATLQVLRPSQLPELDQIYPFLCQAQRSSEVEWLMIDGLLRWQAAEEEGGC